MPGVVVSLTDAVKESRKAQKEGGVVVTTNGSFDLFHLGHEFLLLESRKQGDVLIVGVNSNASVKRYKGEDRPIESEEVRAANVARLADYVFLFEEDDPREWLRMIRPDVHCNAASYGEDCIEKHVLQEIGAELYLVPVKKDLGSTTEILRKRQQS